MFSLTTIRPKSRRDSYTAEDQFCADLDRRLSLIQQWKKKETSGSPQPWNPYPDSLHSSSLETHVHRLSVAKGEGTSSVEFPTTPPPRLQKKRGRRTLSAESVYSEVDIVRPRKAKGRRYEQYQTPTNSEEAEWEEYSQAQTLAAHGWANHQGFVCPKPAAPPKMNQQIRETMIRRAQARHIKERPHTHYKGFDDEAFGKRLVDTRPKPRRKSLLSVELKGEDGEASGSDEQTRSQRSTSTATHHKA